VIVGAAPPKPRAVGQVAPEMTATVEAQRKVLEAYVDTVEQADTLAVPMMTQDVFLQFLGYAGADRYR